MAVETKIEWCDHTFNPWIGCTRISRACDHCYAESLARRYGWAKWGPGQPRRRTGATSWRQPLKWNAAAEAAGTRRRVFCASLADVFDAEVPETWRDDLFASIEVTPSLDWLLLTKRPKVAADYFRVLGFVPANVWLGTTVEDQKMADLRIPQLLAIPDVKVHFLSCEPLLGPIDLRYLQPGDPPVEIDALNGTHGVLRPHRGRSPHLDWVIAGGESGPKARPAHPDWIRALRDQCAVTGTAFFFKQYGEWAPAARLEANGRDFQRFTDGTWMQRLGKKAAGAMLDGREWREFPQ